MEGGVRAVFLLHCFASVVHGCAGVGPRRVRCIEREPRSTFLLFFFFFVFFFFFEAARKCASPRSFTVNGLFRTLRSTLSQLFRRQIPAMKIQSIPRMFKAVLTGLLTTGQDFKPTCGRHLINLPIVINSTYKKGPVRDWTWRDFATVA